MDHLIKEVNVLVDEEYGSAATKFGCVNHSDHESFSILQEELEEACDEVTIVAEKCSQFWAMVKGNESSQSKKSLLRTLREAAVLAACEFIQVAAMAYKAELTLNNSGEHR